MGFDQEYKGFQDYYEARRLQSDGRAEQSFETITRERFLENF